MNEKAAFSRIATEALKILHGSRPMPVVQVGDHAPEPARTAMPGNYTAADFPVGGYTPEPAQTAPWDSAEFLRTPAARQHYDAEMSRLAREAELFFIRKLEATANEMRKAVHHLDDASMRFSIAQANEQFEPLRDAGQNILRITDQIAFLAGGIKSAIEKIEQE